MLQHKSALEIARAVKPGCQAEVPFEQGAQLTETIKVFDRFDMTRGTALLKSFEHQTHHRGQTTVYLRMAKVTPPQEKLF